jgi:hypothetical protein
MCVQSKKEKSEKMLEKWEKYYYSLLRSVRKENFLLNWFASKADYVYVCLHGFIATPVNFVANAFNRFSHI